MRILAIETSCDETAVAILECSGTPRKGEVSFNVLSNIVLSQAALHAEYGGVFPSLAKREHSKNLIPALKRAFEESKFLDKTKETLPVTSYRLLVTILEREPELFSQIIPFLETTKRPDIDAIAVTYGPGLEPTLWVGINFAKALALVWDVPLIPVNHMEGHLVASLLAQNYAEQTQKNAEKNSDVHDIRPTRYNMQKISFPILALLVSGGHTELVLSRDWLNYEIIGETRDDAAGEAFDKVARMLGLGYPGGPAIAREAEKFLRHSAPCPVPSSALVAGFVLRSSASRRFPRPMLESDDYDFSFSGLKTAVLYRLKKLAQLGDGVSVCESQRGFCVSPRVQSEIAQEFQEAVTDVLVSKTIKAAEKYDTRAIAVGGGVSANEALGEALEKKVHETPPDAKLFIAPREFTGDNAVMIGVAAYIHTVLYPQKISPEEIRAEGTLRLG